MKTLSLIAQKGGTGKTTLSIHLAVRASLDGIKVLLLDVDPQASATAWWRRRSESIPALVQADWQDLADKLDTARRHDYGLVVIDTAPHSSEEARTCAGLSDRVCIPTRPAILDLDAIGAIARADQLSNLFLVNEIDQLEMLARILPTASTPKRSLRAPAPAWT